MLRLEQANLEILQLHLSYIQETQGRQMFNDGSEEIKKGKKYIIIFIPSLLKEISFNCYLTYCFLPTLHSLGVFFFIIFFSLPSSLDSQMVYYIDIFACSQKLSVDKVYFSYSRLYLFFLKNYLYEKMQQVI